MTDDSASFTRMRTPNRR